MNTFPENVIPDEFESVTDNVVDAAHPDYIAENGVNKNPIEFENVENLEELQSSANFDETGECMPFDELFEGIHREFQETNTPIHVPENTIAILPGTSCVHQYDPGFYSSAFPWLFLHGNNTPNCQRQGQPTFKEIVKYLLEIETPIFRRDLNFLFHSYDTILKKQLFRNILYSIKTMQTHQTENICNLTQESIKLALEIRLKNHYDASPTSSLLNEIRNKN